MQSSENILDPSKLKVLIVDDEPMLRSVIEDFLGMLGVERHYVAGDGLEALELIRRESVDCMLSDIRMPKMELEELLGIIHKEFPNLIVVATSGYSDLASARNIFLKGAHDFLGKPLNLDALELALHWIVERQRILLEARKLFGREAMPVTPAEAPGRLNQLADCLARGTHHFQDKIRHGIRMAYLLRRIGTDLTDEENTDLQLAAMLHELGTGYQIQSLCSESRALDDDERLLVQEHAPITGRLVAQAIERPELNGIIRNHLAWRNFVPKRSGWAIGDYQAVWLGLVNYIDGFLHDRPDRPAISTHQLRGMLEQKQKKVNLTPVELTLKQWDLVEAFYAEELSWPKA